MSTPGGGRAYSILLLKSEIGHGAIDDSCQPTNIFPELPGVVEPTIPSPAVGDEPGDLLGLVGRIVPLLPAGFQVRIQQTFQNQA